MNLRQKILSGIGGLVLLAGAGFFVYDQGHTRGYNKGAEIGRNQGYDSAMNDSALKYAELIEVNDDGRKDFVMITGFGPDYECHIYLANKNGSFSRELSYPEYRNISKKTDALADALTKKFQARKAINTYFTGSRAFGQGGDTGIPIFTGSN